MAKANIPEKGAIVQRDMETYLIHPHIPGGFVEPKLLRKIADVAEKYGAKYLKLTGAQRIAIIGLQEKDLDNVWAEFEDRKRPSVSRYGPSRSVLARGPARKRSRIVRAWVSLLIKNFMASRRRPSSRWEYRDAQTAAAIPG